MMERTGKFDLTEVERKDYIATHPILKMVILMYSEEADKKKERAKMLEKSEQNIFGDEDGTI
jgi:hypothetical protein